jgi:hypothetical protein
VPAALDGQQRARAPQDVGGERRLLPRQAAREVDGGDGLVHGVGLHVLVEERRRRLEPEPAQAGGVAAVGDRRRHLEQREVPDDRAAQAAVQPAQRHQVDGRQRRRRQVVEVGAVAGVEAGGGHGVGEQLGVHALGPAAAVLVGLDLHQRGLRRTAQAGDRPGVRIGLLELVRRPVRQELEHLVGGRVALHVARQRRGFVGILDRAQRDVHLLRRGRRADVADGIVQGGLEARLERAAQRQQGRLPLPALVDAGQPAVVQLVAAVQRELEVLVGERVGTGGQRDRRQVVGWLAQRGEQGSGRVAARFRSRHALHTVPRSAGS